MTKLVSAIIEKDYDLANTIMAEKFAYIMGRKLVEAKKRLSAKMCAEMDLSKERPATSSIEDRRPAQKPINQAMKADRVDRQVPTSGLKGDKEESLAVKINNLKEDEQIDEARVKIVTRIRGGKIQRRKRLSNVPGMTLRNGSLKRMSPAERRKRKLGARRAKIKRKGKKSQMLMKRRRSLRKRKAMGL